MAQTPKITVEIQTQFQIAGWRPSLPPPPPSESLQTQTHWRDELTPSWPDVGVARRRKEEACSRQSPRDARAPESPPRCTCPLSSPCPSSPQPQGLSLEFPG